MMKRSYYFVIILVFVCLLSIVYHQVNKKDYGHKVVVCIPVYGQSLALGEEAVRITDFDSLRLKYNDRIVTGIMLLDILIIAVDSNKMSRNCYITIRKLLNSLYTGWLRKWFRNWVKIH